MSEPKPLISRLAMPLFFGVVALLISLGVTAVWIPTSVCAVCGGSGSVKVETPRYTESYHPYEKTLLGDQFRVDPCGECRGNGRVTWVRDKLLGRVEQRPISAP